MNVFDELRFGAQRTLNLREGLPAAADALRRCENWLREQQIRRASEVLVITGRGNQSFGGAPVIRDAVEKLLNRLRRAGVVASHHEHNPGAVVVELAPLRALFEAPARKKDGARATAAFDFEGLSHRSLALLRELAERSLESLGVLPDDARVRDEMHRQLAIIAPGLPSGPKMEDQLETALRSAIADYE